MSQPQLKLVSCDEPPPRDAQATSRQKTAASATGIQAWRAPGFQAETSDPVRRVFEHWVAISGREIRRCKLGPVRRQSIAAALAIGYEEDDLTLAVEGHLSDPLEWLNVDGLSEREAQRKRFAVWDLDWLMVREKRIEAAIERGEHLRQLADAEARPRAASVPAAAEAVDPAVVAEKRRKLAELAARMAGRAG